jgi:hypothetical protein
MPTDSEIETLVRRFEDCSLPRSDWTHASHLVMALWYLRLLPKEEATLRIREGIGRYNRSQDNVNGYHETITLAWVEVVERFLSSRDRSQPISTLAGALLEACGDKDHLLRYYSKDVLMSGEARRNWVAPDRKDFS